MSFEACTHRFYVTEFALYCIRSRQKVAHRVVSADHDVGCGLAPLAGKIGCFLPHRVDRGLPLETPKRVSIQIWQGRTST